MFNPARWPLRTKLLTSIVTLFVVIIAIIGAATVLTTRNSLMTQVDAQLADAQRSLDGPGEGDAPGHTDGYHRAAPGLGGSMLRLTIDASSTANTIRTSENVVLTPGSISTLSMPSRPRWSAETFSTTATSHWS